MTDQLIYLIGSLRNPRITEIGNTLRALPGFSVFDDWVAAGPEADDYWQAYEKARGHTFVEALNGWAAHHVYFFDKEHLDRADIVILVLPAGKSGHLELGYAIGKGKIGYIVLDSEPERYDVMYKFADRVFATVNDLVEYLSWRLDNGV